MIFNIWCDIVFSEKLKWLFTNKIVCRLVTIPTLIWYMGQRYGNETTKYGM